MSELLEALRLRQELPDHAAALAHYSHQAALATKTVAPNPFTVRFAPTADKVTTIKLHGAEHTVSVETVEHANGALDYVDCILLGDKHKVWHSAVDTLGKDFCEALDAQLQIEIAADRADFPHGVPA